MARFFWAKRSPGFSLVELMIVVAIISVLAMVGVPTYRRLVARAKKSEARVALGGVFTVEQTFQGEFGVYGSNLRAMGYELPQQANPIYSVGFPIANCNNIAIEPPNAGAVAADINARNPSYYAAGNYEAVMGRRPVGFAATCSVGNVNNAAGTFLATATGAISPGVQPNNGNLTQAQCDAAVPRGNCQDVWTIDQNRDLRNIADGANR